jgi:hypothetical protein
MIMKKLLLIAAFAAAVSPVDAQTYFPMKKGAVLEYKYFDSDGKPLRDRYRNERWTRFGVEEVWGDSVANVVIENETFARLTGVEAARDVIDGISYGDVRVTPTATVFENIMWTFMPESLAITSADHDKAIDQNEMLKSVSEGVRILATVSATVSLPRELHVGDELPEVRYQAVFAEELPEETLAKRTELIDQAKQQIAQIDLGALDPSVRDMFELVNEMDVSKPTATTQTAVIRNRRVVAQERLGGYDCWKITYDIVGPTERTPGMPRFKVGANGMLQRDESVPPIFGYVDYISPEVGLVKREKLNFRGNKVEEVMSLVEVR